MKNPLNEEKIIQIRKDSEAIRGRILETSITIEFLVSKIIVDYFSKVDKRDDFFRYIVSDKITFDTKKNILASLKKDEKISSNFFYKELIADLNYLQTIRNLMAHTNLSINAENVNNYTGEKSIFKYIGTKNYGKDIIINHNEEPEDLDKLIYSFPKIIFIVNRVITGLENRAFTE